MTEMHSQPAGTPAGPAEVGGRRFLRSTAVVSGSTMVSRVLGLVREVLAARLFGLSAVWDLFLIAWMAPNLFRRIFGEGALASSVVPVFAEYHERGDAREADRFFGAILGLLATVLGVLAAAGVVALHFAGGGLFRGEVPAEGGPLFASFLQILLPYLPMVCVAAILGAGLNTAKHFLAPALAPAILNVFWVGALLGIPVWLGVERLEIVAVWIGAAILAGGVCELGLQIPFLRRFGLRPVLSCRWDHPGVRKVLRLMGPTVLGLMVLQLNLLLDSGIALAFIPGEGAVSALYFANRLVQFPLALIGVAVATVAFPYLADRAAAGDAPGLSEGVRRAGSLAFRWAWPATVGLVVLCGPIVELVYRRGAFDAADASRTAGALAAYAGGLWSYCLVQVTARGFYAMQKPEIPVRVGVACVIFNLVMNLILVGPLRETGLALATALASVANLVALTWLLGRRTGRRIGVPGGWGGAARVVFAGAIMGVSCRFVAAWLTEAGQSALVTGFVSVLAGMAIYGIAAQCLGIGLRAEVGPGAGATPPPAP